MTYGELRTMTDAIAGGLAARGVGIGDAVGVFLPMLPETVATVMAVAKLGAIFLPIFSGPTGQVGILPASLILTVMIVPIISSLCRELFSRVPHELADGWTVVTADGRRSAHFEHTIAVTDHGPEVLTLPR